MTPFFKRTLTVSLSAVEDYLEAQHQSKKISFSPFYACTLRFLVPRCCRVPLQPGLGGQYSISFVDLQGAETPGFKPDLIAIRCSGKTAAQRGLATKSGIVASEELLHIHFQKKQFILSYPFSTSAFKNLVQVNIHQQQAH